MVGAKGLENSSKCSILSANYISNSLKDHFKTRFSNNGLVAHECILDCSDFFTPRIKEKDVAKRLMD